MFDLATIWGLLCDKTCRETWMHDNTNPICDEWFTGEHLKTWQTIRRNWDSDPRWFDVDANTQALLFSALVNSDMQTVGDTWNAYGLDCTSKLVEEYHERMQLQALQSIRLTADSTEVCFSEVAELCDRFMKCRDAVVSGNKLDTTVKDSIASLLEDWKGISDGRKMERSWWGIPELDLTAPLIRSGGNIVVIAARPAIGKTAMACSMIAAQILDGAKVGMISLEMPVKTLIARVLACLMGIDFSVARYTAMKDLPQVDHQKVMDRLGLIEKNLKCVMCANSVDAIHSQARSWAAQGVTDIYLDYIQAIGAGKTGDKYRFVIQEMSSACKDIARDYNVSTYILAQLNRESAGKAPATSHLSECSFLEQVADIIVLLDRPEKEPEQFTKRWYCQSIDEGKGQGWALVRKNREGSEPTVNLKWHGPSMRYSQGHRVSDDNVPNHKDWADIGK